MTSPSDIDLQWRLERDHPDFSQVPFWFWNDTLNCDEISRQIEDFKEHGIRAFVIHPRSGLPNSSSWMSEELLSYMEHALREAAKRDMWVMLYDEAMYPSGSSAGQVVEENSDFACRGLIQIDLNSSVPGDTVQGINIEPSGPLLKKGQHLVAEVRRQHDGHKIAIIDTPIGSTIRGLHFTEEDPPRRSDHREVEENHPPAADLLNPEAMQCFIRLVYQKYHDRFASFFGNTIQAIFTDEPDVLGKGRPGGLGMNPRPGTTNILEHVNRLLGYDFVPHIPALWDDREPDAEKYRSDYDRAIRLRLQETYYRPISKWCDEHNIQLSGHPEKSDDIGLLRHFHIPGQDIVWRYIEPNHVSALSGPHSTMGKCASSAMLHQGRRRNLNEFAGAYGHDLSFRTYRWLALWVLIRGCNMLVPHAFYYSTRGPRVDERPRDVGPNSPWWHQYKEFSRLTNTICWLNTDSRPICDIAILGLHDQLPWESALFLYEGQIDFNYLEERSLLEDCRFDSDGIHIGPMNYKILIVEDLIYSQVSPESQSRLQMLEHHSQLIRWNSSAASSDLLNAIDHQLQRKHRVDSIHKDIRIRCVAKSGYEWLMIFNEGEHEISTAIQWKGHASGTLINLDTDQQTRWKDSSTIHLDPHAFMVIRSSTPKE